MRQLVWLAAIPGTIAIMLAAQAPSTAQTALAAGAQAFAACRACHTLNKGGRNGVTIIMAVGNQSGASSAPKRVNSSEKRVKIKVTRPRQTSRIRGCGVVTKTRWCCLFITALSRDAMPSGVKVRTSECANLVYASTNNLQFIWRLLII